MNRIAVFAPLLSLALSGCFLAAPFASTEDAGGAPDALSLPDSGQLDAGEDPDAGAQDAGPLPDAGPPPEDCTRGRPTPVATVDQFASGTLSDAVVEDGWLTLPVQTYAHGVVRWSAYEGAQLSDDNPTIAEISQGFAYATLLSRLGFPSGAPPEVTLGATEFSLVIDGELLLLNQNLLSLSADDRAVAELEAPMGLVTLQAHFLDASPAVATVEPGAGSDQFYPLTVGMDQHGGGVRLAFEDGGADIDRDRMRVDLADQDGRFLLAWDDRANTHRAPSGGRFDLSSTFLNDLNEVPEATGLMADTNYLIRWQAMVHMPEGGGLLVSGEDRVWLFVDGVYYGSNDAEASASGLSPGWHEVMVALEERAGGDGMVHVEIETPGGSTEEIVREEMRARPRSGGALIHAAHETDQDVAPGATRTTSALLIEGDYAGGFELVEVSAIVETEDPGSVLVRWNGPDGIRGSAELLETSERIDGSRYLFRRRVITDASGDWTVSVENRGPAEVHFERGGVLGQLLGTDTAYTDGTWTSEAIDLGDELRIDRLALTATVPGGARVDVEVRAAADASQLETAAWSPTSANGAPSVFTRGRVAQIRLTLGTDGSVTPRVGAIEISARACLGCPTDATQRCAPFGDPSLIALYDFERTEDARVADVSGVSPAVDLTVADADFVRWEDGALRFRRPTIAQSEGATRLTTALQASGEVSLEAWLETAIVDPLVDGPARIVSFSIDQDNQGLMLGQEAGGALYARVRSADDGRVQLAGDPGALVIGRLTHVVLTRGSDDTARLYVNGELATQDGAAGDFGDWSEAYQMHFGDEGDGDREWLGALHLVALYDRALSAVEIGEHYGIGPDGGR